MTVQPFTVHVADETLEDLRERLARTRWPGELPHTGWDYGSNQAYIKELADVLAKRVRLARPRRGPEPVFSLSRHG